MDPMQLLDTAQTRAGTVIALVRPEHLSRPTPCVGWDVRTCLNKLVTSTRFWVVSLNEGRRDPFLDLGAPPDLIGSDAVRAYGDAAQACRAAFTDTTVFARTMPAPVPDLDLTGEQMLGVRVFDTTVITWDLATSIGAPHGIDDDQAEFAYQVAQIVIPLVSTAPDRQRFQPGPAELAGRPIDRLIAYTGRDPHWAGA